MDNRDYYGAKNLIDRIDRLSKSASEVKQAIEDFKKDPETAILYVSANRHNNTITLTKDLAVKFLEETLESYNSLIRKSQKEINDIVDSTYCNVS